MLAGYQFEGILVELGKLEGSQDIPPGWTDTLRAFIEISLTNLEAAEKYAQQAIGRLSQEEDYFRAISLWCAELGRAFNQNLEDSYRILEELLEVSRSLKNTMFAVMTASHMARIRFHQGNLEASEKIYLQALDAAKNRRGNLLPIAGEIKMGLGDLYRELDELDKAAENIQQGIELSKQWREAAAMEGYIYLGRVKEARGEYKSAGDAYDKALQMALQYDSIDIDDRMVRMWQARFWISRGWLDRALAWAESLQAWAPVGVGAGPESNRLNTMLGMRESVVLARLFTVKGDYKRASQLIEQLVPVFESLGNLDTVIELMLIKVKILLGSGDGGQAESVMKRTISLACDTGFKRIFLDEGQPVRDLLKKPGIQKLAPDYVEGLLQGPGQPETNEMLSAQELPEVLSERELQVLRYLQTNLTTPEIADEMVIGVNTIRTHIKNIYSKLNVHKRFEAVERGKELDLI
jgi:LuxR family maltose regulon positive regulatory protein